MTLISSDVTADSSFTLPQSFAPLSSTASVTSSFTVPRSFALLSSTASVRSNFQATVSPLPGTAPAASNLSGSQPAALAGAVRSLALDTFSESPNGLLLISNGIEPVLRWDTLSQQAEPAGVTAPMQAVTLSGSGLGGIVGTYWAYSRFVDRLGNYSNLSPLSASWTAALTTGVITNATNAAPITLTASAHGLTTGTLVNISGVAGNTGANGTWVITVLDVDTFSLNGSAGNNAYLGGGTWSAGMAKVTYTNVPVTAQASVTRRQILRNTAGQTLTFYIDVDTDDLTSTTLSSTLTDNLLAAQPAQPLFTSKGEDLANLYSVPPNHKAVLCHHLNRMFAAVEVPYSQGVAVVAWGSTTVQGLGTQWRSSLVGRYFYGVGAPASYLISSVDETAQTLTLQGAYGGASDPYLAYAIRPAPMERRLIYYSEASLPEAWSPFNTLALQEDGDEITGLMAKGSFLYILERKHIYRFTFQSDPATDGYVFLSANRGCVNNRCWVVAEDTAWMLDEGGVHGFTGGDDVDPVSLPIQDLWETESNNADYRINWAAQQYFHALHYPGQQTIRWFVTLSGGYLPRHALTLDYRLKRWWVEEYPFAVGSSCLARLLGEPKLFLGGPAGRIYAFALGSLDGPNPQQGTVRGQATSATTTSLSDTLAVFPSNGLVGSPIHIVSGKGKGQVRTVASVAGSRVNVTQPWLTLPDTTSVYQLGGIQWWYRSAWFRFVSDEEETQRRLEITFEPVQTATTLDARLYLDRSGQPLLFDSNYSSDEAAGFSSTQGSADLTADLTKPLGFVQRRLDDRRDLYIDGPRYVQVELRGVSNREAISVHGITLDGVQPG